MVETTWLVRYPRKVEIMYYQVGELLIHEFLNNLIEKEYEIRTNPYSSRNPQANATIERIHQVFGNLVRTYNVHETFEDYADQWMVILAAAAFVVRSIYNQTKGKSPSQ